MTPSSGRTKSNHLKLSDVAPVVVGGLGGSGTRVMAKLLADLGYHMGIDLNESLDDLSFTALFKRSELWPLEDNVEHMALCLDIYLTSRGYPINPQINGEQQRHRAEEAIRSVASASTWREQGKIEDRIAALGVVGNQRQQWGWKEPNSHIVLPFLARAIPNIKYIHIVRNGRDMAYSKNQTQLIVWGSHLAKRQLDPTDPEDCLEFWCLANQRILDLRESEKLNFHIVRFEDLIANTSESLQQLCRFLGLPSRSTDNVNSLTELNPPPSINRHLHHPVFVLDQRQHAVLEAFGY